MKENHYIGLDNDRDGGLTLLGRLVLDARLFGLIPDDETCAGWDRGRLQGLMEQVNAKWDQHGGIPSRLPDDLRSRHSAIYEQQMSRARAQGWDPDANLKDEQ